MDHNWDNDTLTLVITRADLPINRDIVDAVFDLANNDPVVGETVAKFLVLGLAIMFQGSLQFIETSK